MLEDLCDTIYKENFKLNYCCGCYECSKEEIDFIKAQINYLNKLLILELSSIEG